MVFQSPFLNVINPFLSNVYFQFDIECVHAGADVIEVCSLQQEHQLLHGVVVADVGPGVEVREPQPVLETHLT